MKLRSKVLVMILLLGVIQISCEPQFISENCTGENKTLLEPIEIEGLNFENCGSSDLLPGSESYVVITSKLEFNKYIICNQEFQDFDFSRNIIVAGKYYHENCAEIASQELYLCGSNIIYEVRINEQICNKPTELFFFAVVPREYKNYKVIIDVKL
jgi:hypothetical protein